MNETLIWDFSVPEITLNELFTAQGADYSKRSPRPNVVELNNRLLQEAEGLAKPIAVWNEAQISGIGEQALFLEKGPTLTSKLLPIVAGTADKLVLIAMTIGMDLDDRVAEYSKAGKTLESFILDAAGSTILAKSAALAFKKIEDRFQSEGMSSTFPLGPGHSYWPGLEDVRLIIDFLNGGQIGINLTDSNLMLPRKSLALVMGVGKNLPDFKGKTHCDFCSLQKTCNMKKFGDRC